MIRTPMFFVRFRFSLACCNATSVMYVDESVWGC